MKSGTVQLYFSYYSCIDDIYILMAIEYRNYVKKNVSLLAWMLRDCIPLPSTYTIELCQNSHLTVKPE